MTNHLILCRDFIIYGFFLFEITKDMSEYGNEKTTERLMT